MTSISLHRVPTTAMVARAQVRATFTELRKASLLVGAALLVVAIVVIASVLRTRSASLGEFGPWIITAAPVSLIALIIPFAVWRSETPGKRVYHWAMPVARAPHTLIKVAAGWLWVASVTVVYSIVTMAFLVGLNGASHIAAHLWVTLIPFTAATIAYLLVSIAVVASDHPAQWVGGVFITVAIGGMLATSLHVTELARVLHWIVSGPYGFASAMLGDFGGNHAPPDMHSWLVASAVWGGIGLAGVGAAAELRKEA